MSMNQKGFAPIILLVGALVIIAVGGGAYYLGKGASNKDVQEDKVDIEIPESSIPQPTTNNVESKPSPQQNIVSKTTPTPVSSPTGSVRKIQYKTTQGWSKYESSLGFSYQYPTGYSSPKKNPVDPMGGQQKYCEFISTRKPEGAQNVESLTIRVRPYTGGSRREFLINTFGLNNSQMLKVEESELSGLKGLVMTFKPEYPVWAKNYAAIFIQGSTALMIFNSHINDNLNEWNSVLESLQIYENLHVDIAECQNDWG